MDRVIWDADSRLSQSFNPDSGRWSKTRSVAQATFGMRTHQRCRQHPIPTLSWNVSRIWDDRNVAETVSSGRADEGSVRW